MDWHDDLAAQISTLITEDARCHVWYTSHATWAAEVSRTDGETDVHHLATLNDAKAWCEARVTEARTGSTASDLGRLRACLAAMSRDCEPQR
jgi:hypothetical protein